MKLASRLRTTLVLLLAAGIFPLAVGRQVLAIAPENVLVIYNDDPGSAGDGFQIADYYQQIRPGVHIAPISGVDAILTGAFSEDVGGQDYLDVIRPQILSAIAAIPGDSIDVIVTTKGMPLRIDVGPDPGGFTKWERFSSLESELTRIDSIDTTDKMGDQKLNSSIPLFDSSLASNPYYNKSVASPEFVRVDSGGPFNVDFRLSARLDGYSVTSVQKSIDRAQNVYLVPFGHNIVLDDTGFFSVDQMIDSGGGPGPGLSELIIVRYPDDGVTDPVPLLFDQTNIAIVSSNRPVLGYVSHGTNDGPTFGLSDNYLGEFVDGQFQAGEVQFELANGAVFHTHESFNAKSFDWQYTQNQGLIADWLEVGGTAGLGHVEEPGNGPNNVANEDLLYQMLLPTAGAAAAPGESGALTFVEAAWRATRQLSYVNTVVGDPLMRFQAWLPGDTNLDGMVEFNDFFTLEENWGQSGNFDDGDFNGDGVVNEDDFDILDQNWLSSVGLLPAGASEIMVYPILDAESGWPQLSATLMSPANLDQDLDVDGDDLALLMASYGVDNGGDVDGDGDTDGGDFLLWQQQLVLYTFTADFDIDAHVGANDLEIWENSYANNRGGDADGDGETSGFDFLAWQREATVPTAPIASASTSVPEPCGMLLVCAGVFVLAYPSRASARCISIRCRRPSAG